MKAMLSQPMSGLTDEQIINTRALAIEVLTSSGYKVVNTLFTDEWYNSEAMQQRGVVHVPLMFLAKSIENMCLCDVVYFCEGWEQARGCQIEHAVAKAYGVTCLYSSD